MRILIALILFVEIFGAETNVQSARAHTDAAHKDTATPQWEIDAGGKMAFDVASVKRNKSGLPPSGDRPHSNIPLGNEGSYTPTGGLLSITNYPIGVLIGFAYKLDDFEGSLVHGKLPNWAAGADRFDVEARGPANATKDQMRLMMQSLLADRFKFAAHFEIHNAPIYDLVLAKAGRIGPQLTPYSDAHPCVDPLHPVPPAAKSAPAPICGAFMALDMPDGGVDFGASRVTIEEMADNWAVLPPANIDRKVVDHTGLNGFYDFTINFPKGMWRAGVSTDEPEPSFEELLEDQLGLKLESATGPVRTFVIDHIEEPSAN